MGASRSRTKPKASRPASRTAAAAAAHTPAGSKPSANSPDASGDHLFSGFLPHLIARLAYKLNNDLIEKLQPEGINVARWRILAVLAMGDGITINEIVERAMMQQSALSRVLMTMEEEQYVRRVPRSDDARYVEVFLTEKGKALFDTLDPVVRRRQNRLLKGFSPGEIEATFELMRRLIHNLDE